MRFFNIFNHFLFIILIFCVFLLPQTSNQSSTYAISSTEQSKQTDTVPSRNYTVVIDPGHGGFDVK